MITGIFSHHRRKIAGFLLMLFYLQLCMPMYAANRREEAMSRFSFRMADNNYHFLKPVADKKYDFYTDKSSAVTTKIAAAPKARNSSANKFIPAGIKAAKGNRKLFSGGPGQPEMQSFQSVNSNNMVDLFSGDFSYNIPLLDVGGYPVNIHYRSGVSMDQEASWVGLGWNISPGSVNRNMRGVPDDFNGDDQIVQTTNIRTNWTAGVNVGLNPEIFGKDLKNVLGLSGGIFYNNYRGIGIDAGISASLQAGKGSKSGLTAGLGISLNNNSQNGISVSPSFDIMQKHKDASVSGNYSNGFSISPSFSTRSGLQSLSISAKGTRKHVDELANQKKELKNSLGGTLSFAHQAYTPTISNSFTSLQFNFTLKLGLAVTAFHALGSISGYFSSQYIAKDDRTISVPAYGYLYYSKSRGVPNALLDFNREKELIYRESPSTPHLAIPNYTYDIYSINGEGTGGMFRPYRGDMGFVHDHEMASKSITASGGIDLGAAPNLWHGGFDLQASYAATTSRSWTLDNELQRNIQFKDADSTYEPVYFRNPGEKTINTQDFYDKIGDTDPIMPVLSGDDDPTLTPYMQPYKNFRSTGNAIKFDANTTYKKNRDKRSQVISYLTANDAANFGLAKKIANYPVNRYFIGKCDSLQVVTASSLQSGTPPGLKFYAIQAEARNAGFRRGHHLSEINVLNADGKKYVYGLPVYNLEQQEVSFAVNKSNADVNAGLASYTPGAENSEDNKEGKDNYFHKETIPAYAHSFLLTGIVSPDYVDRLNDGITDDDQGDAIRFNYSRVFDVNSPFLWRTPFEENKATYNEGLKTDYKDDKGSYIYGKKEIWYLNSVESKTMLATFELNDPATGDIRKDGYAVKGENGGKDLTKSLRYLKKINLYTKADYIKNGTAAIPIKTVNFSYSYELCKGAPSSADANTGKLTLKRIWFTYNGNDKNIQNPYKFYYHPADLKNNDTLPLAATNPVYDNKGYDRWGNYKAVSQNPAGMSNADYPYATQDSLVAANNIRAWTLSDIQLPSGGRVNAEYESDDYAFVQNKRAARFFQLAGFGSSPDMYSSGSNLYNPLTDNRYVFIKVPVAVQSKQEVYKKYLAGINKLYFKMRVKMPKDVYGEGFENITTYAQWDDYGTTDDATVFWILLKGTHDVKPGIGEASPLTKTAIQALRLNLPSKAYPASDLDGDFSAVGLIKSMVGFGLNFTSLFLNFSAETRLALQAREVDLQSSFIRLDDPAYSKYGGGLRVKRITVYDSWDKMTGQKEARYGQEYDYTTIREIDGKKTRISSGVASWEPGIGNDENPFREPIEYDEQIAPLAPVNNMYSEYPLGEAFFPSASIGYSKVRVHTINAKNIKSATGYQESEFYTSYDFPTLTDRTELTERKYKSGFLESLFRINALRYLAQAQGFKVETNDMNGREKAMASYAENDPVNPISYTKYFYKVDDPNAEFKHLSNTVMLADSSSGHINAAAQVGKDIEVMTDFREHFSETIGGGVEFNVDGFIIGFIPVGIPMVWPSFQYEANRYRSAATVKVVQRYGILDKVMQYDKGSLITTEDLLYDGETGDVVLTKTQNEFNDPVYNFSFPAHWAYTGMGPAYRNIGAKFRNIKILDGKITSAGVYKNIESFFESGDEIMTWGSDRKSGEKDNKDDCTGEILACRTDINTSGKFLPEKLWAIDASKIQNNKGKTGIYFIDSAGKFFSATSALESIVILRSGKRNILSAPAGVVSSLVNPLQQNAGKWSLLFNDSTKVVNTGAGTFKDFWKVEDVKYQKDTIRSHPYPAAQTIRLELVNNYIIDQKNLRYGFGCPSHPGAETFANTSFVEVQRHNPSGCNDEHDPRGLLEFNISTIPAGATIVSATLDLPPHDSIHVVASGDFQHTNVDPHYYDASQGGNNQFLIARITDPWYSNPANLVSNDNGVLAQNALSKFAAALDYTTAVQVPANIKPDIPYSRNVTAMVQAISDNRSLPSMIGMIMTTPTSGDRNRVCFQAKSVQDPNNTKNKLPGISLSVTYASCTSGQELKKVCNQYYCYTYDTSKICLPYILDTAVNPYRWGILGCWRADKAYTYYEKRRESDPDQETDIRKNGVLAKFVPYWSFTTTNLKATADTFRWVWNTETTLFNRKGFEIENRDPLGRYNALLYGYNQTVPIAVSQNAKYREQAFEGFEDFGFQNDKCPAPCAVPRHLNISQTDYRITTDQAHTGRYSLGISANDSLVVPVVVEDSIKDQTAAGLTLRIDTSIIKNTVVTPIGKGLSASYYNLLPAAYLLFDYTYGGYGAGTGAGTNYPGEDINFDYAAGIPNPKTSDKRSQYYAVSWEGLIQAPYTGEYQIRMAANNAAYVSINGVAIYDMPNDPAHKSRYGDTIKVRMQAGQLYSLSAKFAQGSDAYDPIENKGHRAVLEWAVPGSTVFNAIGKVYYYPNIYPYDTVGSVKYTKSQCIRIEDIRASNNIILNKFSPLQKTRLAVSAWVKEDRDCKCESYANSKVRVSFFNAGNTYTGDSLFSPSGNIIDGWQRIEEYITVPAGTATMKLTMLASNQNGYTGRVYFDDVRVHPFNANMKSYVYDPVNMRLMAALDENNYASFYEYDDDGTLIRVKKETERGIKTISETRSALIKN